MRDEFESAMVANMDAVKNGLRSAEEMRLMLRAYREKYGPGYSDVWGLPTAWLWWNVAHEVPEDQTARADFERLFCAKYGTAPEKVEQSRFGNTYVISFAMPQISNAYRGWRLGVAHGH